ncbi:C6 zinc finger domain protein [Truncatella angustata]|uniref:C6 zinc finger domain protein n=1 Tax=Truncatella angustata TaxID=152316 RepID=A0A9P8UAF1_9PEZI|nr:C6 zinc finger domain protein [Truncatella angustata]KAH6643361.1 C6 zinc finger domain protein [Truncatella angustata]
MKKKRKAGTRSRTARHTRCDETKPVCNNCARLNLECQPSEFITQSSWSAPSKPAELTTDSWDPSTSTTSSTSTSTSTNNNNNFGTAWASLPKPTSTWDLFNVCMPDFILDENDPPTSVSSGLLSSSSSALPSSSSSSTPALAPGTLHLPHQPTIPLTAEIAHLLAVYQTGVATWMDIFDHTCAYQREVPRRCLNSELLMRSICAFTAKHLSLLPSGLIWASAASGYYGDSLRLLIRHFNSDDPPDDALTATVLLSSYEMIAAQGREHQRHFYGAMVLITTRGINALSQGMDRANFWVYIRHEITVALVNETPLQINPREWNASWYEGMVEEDALGNHLLYLVGRAIDVAYSRALPASTSSERHAIQAEAARWFNALPTSYPGVRYGEPDVHGFNKTYFAIPAADQVQYHAMEIANIALSDIPQSVRSFSAQPLFFGLTTQNHL